MICLSNERIILNDYGLFISIHSYLDAHSWTYASFSYKIIITKSLVNNNNNFIQIYLMIYDDLMVCFLYSLCILEIFVRFIIIIIKNIKKVESKFFLVKFYFIFIKFKSLVKYYYYNNKVCIYKVVKSITIRMNKCLCIQNMKKLKFEYFEWNIIQGIVIKVGNNNDNMRENIKYQFFFIFVRAIM